MDGLKRLLLKLPALFNRPVSKFNQRLPLRGAVLVLIGARREGHPLLAVLFVARAVAQYEADARECKIGKPAQRVLFVWAESDTTDHWCELRNVLHTRSARLCVAVQKPRRLRAGVLFFRLLRQPPRLHRLHAACAAAGLP